MNIIWTEPEKFTAEVKERITKSEIILDIGCGIRPQNSIKPRVHICVDPNIEYLNYLQQHILSYTDPEMSKKFRINPFCSLEPDSSTSYIFINADWEQVEAMFPEKSADSVFLLNVIEHLDKEKSRELLKKTERIARHQLVLFTSSGNGSNNGHDPWGMSGGLYHIRKSDWVPADFNDDWTGYGCNRFNIYGSDGALVKENSDSFYAIKEISPFNSNRFGNDIKSDELAEALSKLAEYALSADNDTEKANKYLLRSLEVKPGYSEALNNLGAVAWMKEEKEEALDYFLKAYHQDPSSSVYVANTADVLLALSRKEEACEILSGYLEYYSNDVEMKQRYYTAAGKEWDKESKAKISNLEFWRKMQDDNYFENHVFYGAGSDNLPLYGKDTDLINRFVPLDNSMNVAIIGCGYGRESVLIGPHVKHIFGIDVNRKILDKAVKYVNKHGVYNFTGVLADSWRRDITEKIDFVFEVTVFQHITRDLTRDYISGLAEKLNDNGRMLLQFLDCDYGTRDAELTAYEPTVVWEMKDIEELAEEFNLSILNFEKVEWPQQSAAWHWVLFGKKN